MNNHLLSGLLLVLFLLSAFLSGAGTAMRTANRHRLRQMATEHGHRGARSALALIERSDELATSLLLANTLINCLAAILAGYLAIECLGDTGWALVIGATSAALFLVFFEIPVNAICASHADRMAPAIGVFLALLTKIAAPFNWLVTPFTTLVLRLMRPASGLKADTRLPTAAEMGSFALESASLITPEQLAFLAKLHDLDAVTVDDLMTTRSAIEILDLEQNWQEVLSQLANSRHRCLPVCRESLDNLLGVLTVRRLFGEMQRGELDESALIEQLQAPYFIPAGTPAFVQFVYFHENRRRFGFVVDEYGEILGLLSQKDIVEEIAGQYSKSLPEHCVALAWNEEGSALVDGSKSLREINRLLGLDFPTDGPRTLNGLILDYLQDIPENGVGCRIAGVQIEVVQTQDRSVRTAKLFRP